MEIGTKVGDFTCSRAWPTSATNQGYVFTHDADPFALVVAVKAETSDAELASIVEEIAPPARDLWLAKQGAGNGAV